MKALVIAQDAQIRESLVAQFKRRGRECQCVEITRLIDESAIMVLLKSSQIGVVINAVCPASLEESTEDRLLTATTLLANVCSQLDVPLLQLSSSRVFDGSDDIVHLEKELPVPVSRESVLLCRLEELVRGACHNYIILRTGPWFGARGDNALTRLLEKFRQGGTVLLSTTVQGCPTHADDIARVISAVVDQLNCGAEVWGTYHYCCADPASSHQFGETVLAATSQYFTVSDLALEESSEVEPRWARPLLNCEKILETFGVKQLPWRSYVAPTLKEILG